MTAAEYHPALPAGLRDRVLAATLQARAAGRPEPAAPEISPAEAFSRAADAFHETLGLLDDSQWKVPALRGLDVQGLAGHLTGVEEDVQRGLAGDPGVAGANHIESTQPAIPAIPAIPLRDIVPWLVLAGAVLLSLVYFVGTEQGATSLFSGNLVHEFMHDARHLLGFPCH